MATPAFISALKSDRCIHYLNNTLVNRAQSIDLSANVPNFVVDELGNDNHVGVITDPAEITFNVSALDTGLDLTKILTGKSTSDFNLQDFMNAQVDYVGVVRDNAGTFFRSVYVKSACINSINYSFDASGNATESYGFAADNLTAFDGFVLTKTYTVKAGDISNGYFALPVQGAEAPIQTKVNSYFGGSYLLRATKVSNGVPSELIEGNDYTYNAANKRITASGLRTGDVWTLVFYSAVSGAAIDPEFNATLPPAVRGRFIPLSIGVTNKEVIPRVQSAGISISFQRERIRLLGSNKILYSPSTIPTVSGNLSVLMSDLGLRKLLTYGPGAGNETQFGIEQLPMYGLQNNLGLEVVIKSPLDNSVLKRITIPDMVTTSAGMPSSVNGTLTESFSWQGKSGKVQIAGV